MDEPDAATSTTTIAPATPVLIPQSSGQSLWGLVLGPLAWVAVFLVFTYLALRLVRWYVEKG